MSVLARPGVAAGLLALAAAILHPRFPLSAALPAREAVAAAVLLLVLAALVAMANVASAGRRLSAWLTAAGFAVVVAALGADGLQGSAGRWTVLQGGARNHFDEVSPSGRSLGLRPLGFSLGFEGVSAAGAVILEAPGTGPLEVSREAAAQIGGYRLADPRLRPSGSVARLRVAMSDGSSAQVVELLPGRTTKVGEVGVSLAEFYADFALDQEQRPFSRSAEPRRPAALLDVEKDGQRHRAFVLRSSPGVHRVQPLGLVFSMLDLEMAHEATLRVFRQPWADFVLAGGVLLAFGLALGAWSTMVAQEARTPSRRTTDEVLLARLTLVGALLLADAGRVLVWQFTWGAGQPPLPGVGPLFGAALLASALAASIRAASRLGGSEAAQPTARIASWLAVGCGVAGLVLAASRLPGPGSPGRQALLELGGLSLAVGLLALAQWRCHDGQAGHHSPAGMTAVLVLAAAVFALAEARNGLAAAGTYATGQSLAAAAAVLLGLAALVPTAFESLARLAFLLGLIAALLQRV